MPGRAMSPWRVWQSLVHVHAWICRVADVQHHHGLLRWILHACFLPSWCLRCPCMQLHFGHNGQSFFQHGVSDLLRLLFCCDVSSILLRRSQLLMHFRIFWGSSVQHGVAIIFRLLLSCSLPNER